MLFTCPPRRKLVKFQPSCTALHRSKTPSDFYSEKLNQFSPPPLAGISKTISHPTERIAYFSHLFLASHYHIFPRTSASILRMGRGKLAQAPAFPINRYQCCCFVTVEHGRLRCVVCFKREDENSLRQSQMNKLKFKLVTNKWELLPRRFCRGEKFSFLAFEYKFIDCLFLFWFYNFGFI